MAGGPSGSGSRATAQASSGSRSSAQASSSSRDLAADLFDDDHSKIWLYKGEPLPRAPRTAEKKDLMKLAAWILSTADKNINKSVLEMTEDVYVSITSYLF